MSIDILLKKAEELDISYDEIIGIVKILDDKLIVIQNDIKDMEHFEVHVASGRPTSFEFDLSSYNGTLIDLKRKIDIHFKETMELNDLISNTIKDIEYERNIVLIKKILDVRSGLVFIFANIDDHQIRVDDFLDQLKRKKYIVSTLSIKVNQTLDDIVKNHDYIKNFLLQVDTEKNQSKLFHGFTMIQELIKKYIDDNTNKRSTAI